MLLPRYPTIATELLLLLLHDEKRAEMTNNEDEKRTESDGKERKGEKYNHGTTPCPAPRNPNKAKRGAGKKHRVGPTRDPQKV